MTSKPLRKGCSAPWLECDRNDVYDTLVTLLRWTSNPNSICQHYFHDENQSLFLPFSLPHTCKTNEEEGKFPDNILCVCVYSFSCLVFCFVLVSKDVDSVQFPNQVCRRLSRPCILRDLFQHLARPWKSIIAFPSTWKFLKIVIVVQ